MIDGDFDCHDTVHWTLDSPGGQRLSQAGAWLKVLSFKFIPIVISGWLARSCDRLDVMIIRS